MNLLGIPEGWGTHELAGAVLNWADHDISSASPRILAFLDSYRTQDSSIPTESVRTLPDTAFSALPPNPIISLSLLPSINGVHVSCTPITNLLFFNHTVFILPKCDYSISFPCLFPTKILLILTNYCQRAFCLSVS